MALSCCPPSAIRAKAARFRPVLRLLCQMGRSTDVSQDTGTPSKAQIDYIAIIHGFFGFGWFPASYEKNSLCSTKAPVMKKAQTQNQGPATKPPKPCSMRQIDR